MHKIPIGQATDCPVQTSDLSFEQQSVDWLRNPQIVLNEMCKVWMNTQSLDCLCCTILGLRQNMQQVWMKREKHNVVTPIENHATQPALINNNAFVYMHRTI